MAKKIAIIGGSYLQIPLVNKAKQMGIETHCFSWEEGAVCKQVADFFYPISILEKEKILEICQLIQIDGITSIASDAAVATVCFVSDKMNLIGNKFNDVSVTTDKYMMRKRFRDFFVLSPKFVNADQDYLLENFKYPLIVKPTDRSGSRGVMKVENADDLKDAIARAKNESFTQKAIIEEYITGSEVSVETISWKGKHYILAITDKVTTGEPFYVELEHHQPSVLDNVIIDKIKFETLKALNALGINYGASHSEFKITENGNVFAIEVGARMGGDFIGSNLVELSTGYDFVKGVVNVALGNFEVPLLSVQKFAGVYFLSNETNNLKEIILTATGYNEIVEAQITDTNLRNIKCSADRSGYLIYQSDKKFNL